MNGTEHLGRSLKIEEARGKPSVGGDFNAGARSFGGQR